MASTYSPSARTELPATGDQNNTWAATVDNNWNVPIEKFIAGLANVALPDANYTLTTANASADEARMAVLSLTGALTAPRDVYIPAVPKLYIVKNGATQRVTLRVNASAGTVTDAGIPQPFSVVPRSGSSSTTISAAGVPIPSGTTVYVYTDGVTVDHCLAGTGPDLAADSTVFSTPLSTTFGGTTASTAAGARSNFGLGTAATLDAATGNSGNTIVQRDGFSNFVAGTVTAGLNGTASTSTNTSLFGGQAPAFYVFQSTGYDFGSFVVVSAFAGAVVDVWGLMGSGPCFLVLTVNGSPYVPAFYAINDGQNVNPPLYTSGIAQIGRYYTVPAGGSLTQIFKLRKTNS